MWIQSVFPISGFMPAALYHVSAIMCVNLVDYGIVQLRPAGLHPWNVLNVCFSQHGTFQVSSVCYNQSWTEDPRPSEWPYFPNVELLSTWWFGDFFHHGAHGGADKISERRLDQFGLMSLDIFPLNDSIRRYFCSFLLKLFCDLRQPFHCTGLATPVFVEVELQFTFRTPGEERGWQGRS